jgi:mono/diheme cytochrome c family protein
MASSNSRLVAAALALALPAGATAPVGAEEELTNPALGDPAAVEEGRRIYRQRCYICHLSNGGRGPNLFASPISDEQFLMIVINGRKGTVMPAFGLQLSPDDVWQVHAYVKSTDHHE